MEIDSTKLKILSKVVASGADTEKKITALQTAEIFQIIEKQKIPAKEMGLILELQNAIKNRSTITFLTGGKDKAEKTEVKINANDDRKPETGIIAKELATYDREVFAVLNLKSNGQPINLNICSMGTLDSSMVSPREVFKSCILSNSAAFIAIHNHPSGNISPSQEDRDVTSRLLGCSELLGIKMLDHIVVAGESGSMYSFKNEGEMDHLRPIRNAWER